MITDDPGTPGNRKWEINLAVAFEPRSHETAYDAPAVDLNYGVGEHLQFTLQTAPVVLQRSDQGPVAGIGSVQAAVKWRFLDEEKTGFDVSMFPRIIFNPAQSSVRRDLTEEGTRFQIPFQIARKLGQFHVDGEFGPLASTVGRSEWLYGLVGGVEVAKATSLMAEIQGTSRTNFTRGVLALNFGVRHEFTETRILIASLGHEIYNADDDLALIGYLGLQLIY